MTTKTLLPLDITNTVMTNIMSALQVSTVLDIGELRSSMAFAIWRGASFDAALLALADTRQIVLAQDCLPESLTPAQLRNYIRCGGEIYTCAMLAR